MVCMRVAFHENDGNHEKRRNATKTTQTATNKELSAGLTETTEATKTMGIQGANQGFPKPRVLGNGRNSVLRVLFRRSELTEPHWVLRQTRWVLRKTRWVRFGTQIIGWEELTEFSPRSSARAKKITEFGVWNRTLRNRIRARLWGLEIGCSFLATIGSFLLTAELFCSQLTILAFLLTVGAFSLTLLAFYLHLELFCLQWESSSNKRLKGL